MMEMSNRPVWRPGGAVTMPAEPKELPKVDRGLLEMESSVRSMSMMSVKTKMSAAFKPAVIDAQLRDGVVEVNLAAMTRDDIQVLVVKIKDRAASVTTLRFRVMPRGIGWSQYEYAAEQDGRARDMYIYNTDWHKEGVAITSANVQHRKVRFRLYAALLDVMLMSKLSDLEIGMRLSASGYKTLSNGLSHNITLKRLSFAGTHMGDEAVVLMRDGLMANNSLEELDLTACSLTDDGVACISDIIKSHADRRVTLAYHRHLRQYPDTSKAPKVAETEFIQEIRDTAHEVDTLCGGLLHLELAENQVSDYGAKSLRDALSFDRRLVLLSLRSNVLSVETESEFVELMREHRALLRVDLRQNLDREMGILKLRKEPRTSNHFSPALGYNRPSRPASPTMTETSRALRELRSLNSRGSMRSVRSCRPQLSRSLSVISWGDAHLLHNSRDSGVRKSSSNLSVSIPTSPKERVAHADATDNYTEGVTKHTTMTARASRSTPASPKDSSAQPSSNFADDSLRRQMFMSRMSSGLSRSPSPRNPSSEQLASSPAPSQEQPSTSSSTSPAAPPQQQQHSSTSPAAPPQQQQHRKVSSVLLQQQEGLSYGGRMDRLFEAHSAGAGAGGGGRRGLRSTPRKAKLGRRKKVKAERHGKRQGAASGAELSSDVEHGGGDSRQSNDVVVADAAGAAAAAVRADDAQGIKDVALMLRDLEIAVSTMELLQELRSDGRPVTCHSNSVQQQQALEQQQRSWLAACNAAAQAQAHLAAIERDMGEAGRASVSPLNKPWQLQDPTQQQQQQQQQQQRYSSTILYPGRHPNSPATSWGEGPSPQPYSSFSFHPASGRCPGTGVTDGKGSTGRGPPAVHGTAGTGLYSVIDQMERWYDLYDNVAEGMKKM